MTVTVDALVTPADVAAQLNDTSLATSDEIPTYISAASQAVQFDPQYGVGPVAPMDCTETHDGGRHEIVLDSYPILSVTSVTEYCGTTAQVLTEQPLTGDTFDSYGYRLNPKIGLLSRWTSGTPSRFAHGCQNVLVSYSAGREVTGDLRMAVLVLIAHMWETQQSWMNSHNPDQLYPAAMWPNRVTELLGQYRRGPIVA